MGKLVWGKNTVGHATYNYTGNEGPPQFKGGINAFYRYIGENLSYPAEAVRYNIQGVVITSFTINKEGKIEEVNILTPVHPLLDQEAKNVLMRSPKWIPGKQRGLPVKVRYTIPISFKLPKR